MTRCSPLLIFIMLIVFTICGMGLYTIASHIIYQVVSLGMNGVLLFALGLCGLSNFYLLFREVFSKY